MTGAGLAIKHYDRIQDGGGATELSGHGLRYVPSSLIAKVIRSQSAPNACRGVSTAACCPPRRDPDSPPVA